MQLEETCGSGCGCAGARVDGGKDTLGSVKNYLLYKLRLLFINEKHLYLLVLSGPSTGVASGSGCGCAGARVDDGKDTLGSVKKKIIIRIKIIIHK